MTIQPFTLSWAYSKRGADAAMDEAGLTALVPTGPAFVKQLKASLKSNSVYSRGAMLSSLSLLAACGGSGSDPAPAPTPAPTPTPTPTPTNSPPQVDMNTTINTNEDTDVSLMVSTPTDADGDALVVTDFTLPMNGDIILNGVVVTDPMAVSLSDIPDLEYRPNPDFNGDDTISYTVSDGTDTASQTISITVDPVNDAPVLEADKSINVDEDAASASLEITTAPSDVDGDALQAATIVALPAASEGIIRIGAGGAALTGADTIPLDQLDDLQFVPAADFDGTTTFEYSVSDGTAATTQTITIEMTPVNDAPDAQADKSVSADLNTAQDLNIAAPVDPDTGETFTITVLEVPTTGDVLNGATVLAVNDTISVTELQALQFSTDASDNIGSAGAFRYSIEDSGGLTDSQTITLSVTSTTFDISGGGGDDSGPNIGQGGPLNGQNGFEITGFSGDVDAVAGDGDFNDDGLDDVVLSLVGGSTIFLVFGGATTTGGIFDPIDPMSVLAIAAENGQTFSGGDPSFGTSLDLQGDVNGDGIEDLIIGEPLAGTGDPGAAYVVFGTGTDGTGGIVGLTSLNVPDGSDGFLFVSDIVGSEAGAGVAVIGDINDDGFEDVAFGQPGSSAGNGEVSIVNGLNDAVADFDAVYSDTGIAGTARDGVLVGTAASSAFSSELSGLGDVNGDDVDDFIVGAPDFTPGGEAVIVFGGGGIAASLTITGTGDFSSVGTVSGNGDFNNDGINDILIGASGSDTNGADSGAVVVLFGQADGTWGFGTSLELGTDALATSDGFVIDGAAAGDGFGTEVAGLGDFNGDGIDDFAVTASGGDGGDGSVYIIFGQDGLSSLDLETADSSQAVEIIGNVTNLGRSIAAAGEVNDDDLADIIIGADDAAYVIYGFGTDAPSSGMAESILALDDGIVLPDDGDGSGDDIPMDTAQSGDGESQSNGMLSSTAIDSGDGVIPDDIDLSGIG
ncbi:MAG: Ig-like domain-containing protein [Pseudomonadota bacterium]